MLYEFFGRVESSTLVLFVFVLHYAQGQRLDQNGDPYFCVPPGICSSSGGIDPRIVTPDGTPTPTPNQPGCPAGQMQCFAQGRSSRCGQRSATITNVNDGVVGQDYAYPWQAFLTVNGVYIGSGSLLSPYHVLTATHKVYDYITSNRISNIVVIMGVNDPNVITPRPNSSVRAYDMSTPYDNSTLKNDITILKLTNPISLNGQINTICLPPTTSTRDTFSTPPRRCVVSGWGQIQPYNTRVPTPLKQVGVTTTDITQCKQGFNGRVDTAKYLDETGGQICAGGEAQKDACFQDGGAPLNCRLDATDPRFYVAGIVIWGKSCGVPGVYGVYTNVPYYNVWIRSILQQAYP